MVVTAPNYSPQRERTDRDSPAPNRADPRTFRHQPHSTVSSSSRASTAKQGLDLVQNEAEQIAGRPSRLKDLARRAQAQMTAPRSRIGSLKHDVPVLARLVRAYATGDYRQMPWKGLLLGIGALLYFVTPIDLIPDFIVGTGFLDDAVVVAYVIKAIRDDLTRFVAWEAANALDDPDSLNPPY